jgi:hypothetical protein
MLSGVEASIVALNLSRYLTRISGLLFHKRQSRVR